VPERETPTEILEPEHATGKDRIQLFEDDIFAPWANEKRKISAAGGAKNTFIEEIKK